ncbi:sugar ABC transporter permease [Corticibacterium sp. UT-5YL-CI-8]|nr:sugar ABC transporter permease [Tianweitania sp. UT-5YL-CI-8]
MRTPGSTTLMPYLLVAPALVVLAIAVLYPIGFNVYASLHQWNLLDSDLPTRFNGLSTYGDVLSDPRFANSLRVTLLMTLFAVGFEFFVGLGLALIVNEDIWARRFFRTVLVAPIMATPLVVALVFRLMWHGEFGVINYYLSYLGIPPITWLAGPYTAFFAIFITEVWHNTAFVFLVLLGAMQMLPREPYEAAIVEGATYWQRLRFITLPLLRSAILVALLFRTVFVIRMFDEVWVLTRGGPNQATETVSIMLFKSAFETFDVSEAGAISVILLLVTAGLALILIRFVYGKEKSE